MTGCQPQTTSPASSLRPGTAYNPFPGQIGTASSSSFRCTTSYLPSSLTLAHYSHIPSFLMIRSSSNTCFTSTHNVKPPPPAPPGHTCEVTKLNGSVLVELVRHTIKIDILSSNNHDDHQLIAVKLGDNCSASSPRMARMDGWAGRTTRPFAIRNGVGRSHSSSSSLLLVVLLPSLLLAVVPHLHIYN